MLSRLAGTRALLRGAQGCRGLVTLRPAPTPAPVGPAAARPVRCAVPPPVVRPAPTARAFSLPSMATMSARRRTIVIGSGIVLLGGTFTWVAYKVSKWSTFDAMYWGAYLGGAASAVLASAVIILGRRMLFLHPEQVFRGVLRVARDSPITQHHLGRDVTPGTFRAYAHTGGFFFDRTKPVLGFIPRPSYRKQGLQILFQLQGKDAGQQGLVSCEVSRHIGRGPLEITSLSLDLQNGERHVLVGSHEDVVYKGVIRLR